MAYASSLSKRHPLETKRETVAQKKLLHANASARTDAHPRDHRALRIVSALL
jgi:hypothetical protein